MNQLEVIKVHNKSDKEIEEEEVEEVEEEKHQPTVFSCLRAVCVCVCAYVFLRKCNFYNATPY